MIIRSGDKGQEESYGGVDILAILNSKEFREPHLILVANYRPPTNTYTLSFPAGLLEPNETLEISALRELKEETGYTGTTILTQFNSPILYGDPWKSYERGKLVVVSINGDLHINSNQSVQQCLDDTECINVHLVPFNQQLTQNIQDIAEISNYSIETKLWTFASALHLIQYFK